MLTSKSYKLTFLSEEALKAFKKFPLPIIFSLVTAMMLLYFENQATEIIALMIGIPLSTALTIYSSTLQDKLKLLVPHLTHLIILIMYLYMNNFRNENRLYLQMFIFAFAAHMFVAFSLNLRDQSMLGFWKFNERLFERFLVSFIFSNTIFVGLLLAIVTVSFLFGVDFPKDTYKDLWYCSVFIFNTWFFVAGIPLNGDAQLEELNFPKKLKMFLEYLLIPLLILYFLLLYIYLFKIIVTQELPKGKIGLLVSFASLFGIFTLLLGHPLYESEEKNWFKKLFLGFYIAVIPLVILTLVGLIYRYNQYGVTESRYLLFTICFWLIGISSYFIFSRLKNIKLIPISLCITSLFISFGPWNIWNVSYKSQKNRFVKELEKHDLYKDGRIPVKAETTKITNLDYDTLFDSSTYLFSNGHEKELNKLLTPAQNKKITNALDLMEHLKISRIENKDAFGAFYFDNNKSFKVVKGYDIFIPVFETLSSKSIDLYENFRLVHENRIIYVTSEKKKLRVEIMNLEETYKMLLLKYPNYVGVVEEDFTFIKEHKDFKIKLIFTTLHTTSSKGSDKYIGEMNVLFSKK